MEMLKIYFIEYDKDGNEIRRGVHPKKQYKTYGRAWRTADMYYGDKDRFEVYIDTKEPWGEYYTECTCGICKETYICRQDSRGLLGDLSVDLYDYRDVVKFRTHKEIRGLRYPRSNTREHRQICPKCYEKITNFIDSITVEELEND